MLKTDGRSFIKLEDNDAAIILKEDGTVEASLPDVTTEDVPSNILMGAALVYALRNPDLCDAIFKNFVEQCSQDGDLLKPANGDDRL